MYRLILANQLRLDQQMMPYEDSALCQVAGHSHGALRVVKNRLRKEGSIAPSGRVVMDHARVIAFDPPLEMLEEKHFPDGQQVQSAGSDMPHGIKDPLNKLHNTAGVLPNDAEARFLSGDMSATELQTILELAIRQSHNTSALPKLIDAWLALKGQNQVDVGPPAPIGDAGFAARLLRIMKCCPKQVVLDTYAKWLEEEKEPDEAETVQTELSGEGGSDLGGRET